MVRRRIMRASYFIAIAILFVITQSCDREGVPPFTVHVHNAYDFDITLSGPTNSCDYGENRATNPLCTLRAGEQRAYDTYGPGRSFIINTYKLGTTEEVGSLHYTGKSGLHYKWVVGTDNPVIEMNDTDRLITMLKSYSFHAISNTNMNSTLHKLASIPIVCFLISTWLMACQAPTNQIAYDETLDNGNLYFAPTMQQKLPTDENAVYAVSFPLAWQTVRKELKMSGPVNSESAELRMLDGSKTIEKALNDDDYELEIERKGRRLHVKTRQEVHLTFVPSFESYPNGLVFDGIPVHTFGTRGFQNIDYINRIDIAAYRDDDRFILRLIPMEQEHELYLFKADSTYATFEQMHADLLTFCRNADAGKSAGGTGSWRYELTDMDEVNIPKVNFDNHHQFQQFLDAIFFVKRKEYIIADAIQQIAFGLNEHGVSMKTEADIITHDGAYPPEDPPIPKQLVFDKPFYMVMKKAEMESPYFALYIANAALLEKESTP